MAQYVFSPDAVLRYRFPTHTNDLIMDRKQAATSEAFFVVLEPGEAPPLHVHRDAEQVFYVLRGSGELRVVADGDERFPLRPGDFVRTPPGVHHAVTCTGSEPFVYLSIDCFVAGPSEAEPTWDSHVEVMCRENGWDLEAVRHGPIDATSYLTAEQALPR